jgi:hypothetical protein
MRATKPDDYKPKLLGSEQKPETFTHKDRQAGIIAYVSICWIGWEHKGC